MEKHCESVKRFGKEEWQKAQRKPRTLMPIQPDRQDADTAHVVSGYVWQ